MKVGGSSNGGMSMMLAVFSQPAILRYLFNN